MQQSTKRTLRGYTIATLPTGQSSLQKIAPTANQFQTAAYTHAQTGPAYSSPANNDPTTHINQSPALPLPPSANDEIQPRGGNSDTGYALVDDQATPAAPEREPEGQEIQTKHEDKKKKTKKNKEKKQKEEYSRMRNTSQDLEILDVESEAPDVAHLASTVSSWTTSDSNVKTSTGSQESRREALEIVVGIVDKTREAEKHIEDADSSMKKAEDKWNLVAEQIKRELRGPSIVQPSTGADGRRERVTQLDRIKYLEVRQASLITVVEATSDHLNDMKHARQHLCNALSQIILTLQDLSVVAAQGVIMGAGEGAVDQEAAQPTQQDPSHVREKKKSETRTDESKPKSMFEVDTDEEEVDTDEEEVDTDEEEVDTDEEEVDTDEEEVDTDEEEQTPISETKGTKRKSREVIDLDSEEEQIPRKKKRAVKVED